MKHCQFQINQHQKVKIISIVLVVFCLIMPLTSSAANGGQMNFFERAAEKFTNIINQAANGLQAIDANIKERITIAANEIQNRIYNLADSRVITSVRNGINSASGVLVNSGQASLSTIWKQIKCFFGFECVEKRMVENTNTNTNTESAIQTQTQAESNKDLTPAETSAEIGNKPLNTEPISETKTIAGNKSQIEDTLLPEAEPKPKETTTIIQPIKEIQTIHTVTNNTNTVIADEDLRAKVNQIMRQLDSDRPSFSLGQPTIIPSNLAIKTLTISSGDFNVDADGNTIANSIVTNGNIYDKGNLTVEGNFTINGDFVSAGVSAFNASSTNPILATANTGSGPALQADNIIIKGSIISTTDNSPLQFFGSSNSLDANGNLIIAGNITPYTTISHDLGSPTNYFNNLYTKTIYTA